MKDTTILHNHNPSGAPRSSLLPVFISLLFLLQACSSAGMWSDRNNTRENTPENLFNISGQMIADDQLRSVQLFKNNDPASPPVINLNGTDKLHLRFDYLDVTPKQFTITFSHYNADWSPSSLAPGDIIQGIRRLYMDSGSLSTGNRPYYRTYSADFPGSEISFLKSGNYMMQIEDADTGYLVMSLPFFIYENEGSLESSVELIQSPRQNMRSLHRPVNRYSIPDNIEQPQFNLLFRIVQNRFWGRSRTPAEIDFSSQGSVRFEMLQEEAFIADYYFHPLSLSDISVGNPGFTDVFPEEIPMRVLLRDDAADLSSLTAETTPYSFFGLPDMDMEADYIQTVFSLDTEEEPESGESLYLVGDFTGWAIRSEGRLTYNDSENRWQTSVVMKEGEYKYKYIRMENNKIDDLSFDPLFERTKQEYQVFVYFQDKDEFYDRLLQVNTVIAGS